MKMVQHTSLNDILHPRSVALVGISSRPEEFTHMYLKGLIDFPFKGPIYPVNPKVTQIRDLQAYPSVMDIPGPVDYVFSLLPARLTPPLVEECVAKEVNVLAMFTSGFREKDEAGAAMEAEIVRIARKGGMRILGPNCLGLYCPAVGLGLRSDFPREVGNVAFISQSGGNATDVIMMGKHLGIRFSKVISYGNASDLSESDFLEYLTEDPETEIIAAYIEGVKDGARFFRALTEAAAVKPVVVLKGGCSEGGNRAATAHTGVLAASEVVWDVALKQSGVIRVYSLEELVDVILALKLVVHSGPNLAIFSIGGGSAVQAADECERAGLVVPLLPTQIQQKLEEFTPDVGTSVRNPVDGAWLTPDGIEKAFKILSECPDINIIVPIIRVDMLLGISGVALAEGLSQAMIAASKLTSKPVVFVLRASNSIEAQQAAIVMKDHCLEANIPVYTSVSSAARALSNVVRHHQRRAAVVM